MANKNLFSTIVRKLGPATNAVNEAGGAAYAFSREHALAQYAATGCLNATFYATAEDQLAKVLALCEGVDPAFVAKTAVYCRTRGHMKDVPALLCAVLSVRDRDLFAAVFPRVIDNGRMLRTFVQIMRSGVVGRRSLGTLPKRLVREWLDARADEQIFEASVGQSPSIADVVKMVHPKPATDARRALYAYLVGRDHDAGALPAIVRDFEDYKAGRTRMVPNVPFQMLTSLDLGAGAWSDIAAHAPWQMTRMNLNTFARHGVFERPDVSRMVARRLRNPKQIAKARVFPYQLMVAYLSAGENVPEIVRDALQEAMEIATANVPALRDKTVYVCPDVSGSMSMAATGYRKGSTSKVRCIDVAALVAASILRKNPGAEVLPFENGVVDVRLNARDAVMTNAAKLAAVGGGGTNCSAPLAALNKRKARGDLVVFVSDNESWMDVEHGRGTATMREWEAFKARNPKAKLVCIDIQPYATSQAVEREDILNVGGFSDGVFDVVAQFAKGELDGGGRWVDAIDRIAV